MPKRLALSILAVLLLAAVVLAAPQYEEAIQDGHRLL